MGKKKEYKGLAKIGNKVYKCCVIDGMRYIDGKTVDQFFETLDDKQKIEMAKKGYKIIKNNK